MRRSTFFFRTFCLLALAGLLLAGVPGQAAPLSGTDIYVNTTADELNSDGDCSLREALRAANTNTAIDACPAGGDQDVIHLPQGTYLLTRTGSGEDQGLTGDLDILSDVSITGAGPGITILDGNIADRVLHIAEYCTASISYLTIRNGNVAEIFGGGGIFNRGTLTLFNVVISNNTSANTGGGMDNIGIVSLRDVTLTGNSAQFGGGAFNGLSLSTNGVTFSGNSSTATGGGLDNGGNATLINTTISGNTSIEGGGVFSDGNLTFYNSTVNQNNQGIFLGSGEMRFKNTIVANSTSGANCQKRAGSTASFTSLGYNLESSDTCDFLALVDLINTNPLLGALSYNDGATQSHALLNGSPAIDGGDNNFCVPIDQRGRLRPADGDNDGTRTCDIGSFEYNAVTPFFNFLPTAFKY